VIGLSFRIRRCVDAPQKKMCRAVRGCATAVLYTAQLARANDGEDLGIYKWRTSALWWFSNPTGSFTGKANSGTFDLGRDFGFGSYSTFSGNADWRFKRKHHFLFAVSPVVAGITRSRLLSDTYTLKDCVLHSTRHTFCTRLGMLELAPSTFNVWPVTAAFSSASDTFIQMLNRNALL
jgi:hypothetical protein